MCRKTPAKRQDLIMIHMTAKLNDKCILQEGWLAFLEGFEESLAGLFQHISLPISKASFLRLVLSIVFK
jgi:hypothetical protein